MLLLVSLTGANAATVNMSSADGQLLVQVDAATGRYEVTWQPTAWVLSGSLDVPLKNAALVKGSDRIGAFQEIGFAWVEKQSPRTGRIRLYDASALLQFTITCDEAQELPPAPFPNFTKLPQNLHIFSHSQREFAPPQFAANEICTPWLLFDDKANAFVISPASHFFVASMWGDGAQRIASGFNKNLRNLPAGFAQQTLLTFGAGINRSWDAWSRAMLAMNGAKRPRNDADVILKYLGYWTDNGATYYYNYDTEKGYARTLQSLVEHYRQEQIPIRYLQLDSWWYSKSTTGADGTPGKPKKVEKLPEGEWNRYGGTLEYRAHKAIFPDGLDAFQKSIGLPLITHGRWIDPASPDRKRYQISGVAPVDPKWWDDTAAYLKSSGVVTYEQDWCDRIYANSPEFSSDVDTGEAFLDNMARASKEQGLSLQYCMPYACYFLQGSRYENLTTIRTCTDRFNPNRWNDFLYTSRLATSMGIWPWADVYNSTERDNVLLSTLSAGAVGIGDRVGSETKTNLFRAVRADGVIVKPDAPIVPLDRSYIADAQHINSPLTSATFTEHDSVRTVYLFACNRPKSPAGEVRFTPAELGFHGPVYVYDFFRGTSRHLDLGETYAASLDQAATAFYVLASIGRSGTAFLGDRDKFVSTGKQRIASLRDSPGRLEAEVIFAEREPTVTLHGYAARAPHASTRFGRAIPLDYDATTQHFSVEVRPDASSPVDNSSGDPVRRVTVILELPKT